MKIRTIFKPTRSTILFRGMLPLRKDGWTSNSFFLFPTSREPSWMVDLKSGDRSESINPQELVDKAKERFPNCFEIQALNHYEISGNSVYQKFFNDKKYPNGMEGGPFETWANAYYVNMFPFARFFTDIPLAPIIVCNGDKWEDFIGIIMPIRR